MSAEPPSVVEIVDGLRGMLKTQPHAETVVMSRQNAQAIVDYFDDIGSFAKIVLKP